MRRLSAAPTPAARTRKRKRSYDSASKEARLNRDSRNWQHDQTHLLAELRDREGADTRTDAKLLKQIRDKLP